MLPQNHLPELCDLAEALCENRLTVQQAERLESLLLAHPALRRRYVLYMQMHAAAECEWGRTTRIPATAPPPSTAFGFLGDLGAKGLDYLSNHLFLFSVLIAMVAAGSLAAWNWESKHHNAQGRVAAQAATLPDSQPASRESKTADLPIARLTRTVDCQWTSPIMTLAVGEELTTGQQLDITSGQAEITFVDEAVVVLSGPSIMRMESGKKARLLIGHAAVKAKTPRAHGFTLVTRTTSVVDLGTEVVVQAGADGHSEVCVTSGAVEVRTGNDAPYHRLEAGQTAQIEPGSAGVVAIIESGDDTAAFKFPTIERPSKDDYADASQHRGTIRVMEGSLPLNSGPISVLLDGRGQSNADAPEESAFFADNEKGRILLDLGQLVRIRKVNTYSWHRYAKSPPGREDEESRAPQRYTLYGSMNDRPPPTAGNLLANGWKVISRVNTDEFFSVPPVQNRPAQQAVSISGTGGGVGHYRFLLWDVLPTHVNAGNRGIPMGQNTFFGEFDVYAE